jgi:hypothetical protein
MVLWVWGGFGCVWVWGGVWKGGNWLRQVAPCRVMGQVGHQDIK